MAMCMTDPRRPDNPIILVNDAFTALTGFPREEAVGRNCRFLQGPDTDAGDVARMSEALRAGQGIELEILNYRKDGTPFWNALVISPVRDGSGEVAYYFASQHDVSEKRLAQIELARSKSLLETQVAHRTQDLRQALDQKITLLHEVDHRVKNSLQVVNSLVLLKARRIKDARAREALLQMAERIGALSTAHRLLYTAGDVSRFDVSEFVGDLAAVLLNGAGAPIALDLRVEPVAVPAAKAAPLALLLNEIMGNAVRHAFPDGRRGRLSVAGTKLDGEFRIVIEDDGIGTSPGAGSDESFGRILIDMLVRQLRAGILWEDAGPGTRAVVTMPLNAEEAKL
jgi:PAS domain S-box-containing protein